MGPRNLHFNNASGSDPTWKSTAGTDRCFPDYGPGPGKMQTEDTRGKELCRHLRGAGTGSSQVTQVFLFVKARLLKLYSANP